MTIRQIPSPRFIRVKLKVINKKEKRRTNDFNR
ncbi:hypothetical protein IGJ16_000803 [Enterococcus pernyi]